MPPPEWGKGADLVKWKDEIKGFDELTEAWLRKNAS